MRDEDDESISLDAMPLDEANIHRWMEKKAKTLPPYLPGAVLNAGGPGHGEGPVFNVATLDYTLLVGCHHNVNKSTRYFTEILEGTLREYGLPVVSIDETRRCAEELADKTSSGHSAKLLLQSQRAASTREDIQCTLDNWDDLSREHTFNAEVQLNRTERQLAYASTLLRLYKLDPAGVDEAEVDRDGMNLRLKLITCYVGSFEYPRTRFITAPPPENPSVSSSTPGNEIEVQSVYEHTIGLHSACMLGTLDSLKQQYMREVGFTSSSHGNVAEFQHFKFSQLSKGALFKPTIAISSLLDNIEPAWRSKAADFCGIYVEGWSLSDVFLDWLVQQGDVIPGTGKTKYDDMMASMGDGDRKHAFKTVLEKCAPNVR